MNIGTFPQLVDSILPDTGFRVDRVIPWGNWRTAAGDPLDNAATSPQFVATGASFDNGESARAWIQLPGDYSEESDDLALRLYCSTASATDENDVHVDAVHRFRVGDAAAGVDMGITLNTQRVGGNVVQVLDFDLSGNAFLNGDILRICVANAHVGLGATDMILHGAMYRYRSILALYTKTERFG